MGYSKIKKNYYFSYCAPYTKSSDVKRCICKDNCKSDCINKKNRNECVIGYCINKLNYFLGDKNCRNNVLQKKDFPKFYTQDVLIFIIQVKNKGIGLFIDENISKGNIIIEYIGDIIDDFELQVRMFNNRVF